MEKKKGLSLQTVLTIAGLALIYLLAFLLDRIPGIPIMLTTVLRKGAIYSLVAVSMNLLNGFTGLFSLGQAGFMLVGAYTFAVLNISSGIRSTVYQYYDPLLKFSLTETLQNVLGNTAGTVLGVFVSLLLAGFLAAVLAYLIGLPVLKLKSDYLAIATLGFAEIIRALVQLEAFAPITNGSRRRDRRRGHGHQPCPSQAHGVYNLVLLRRHFRRAARHVPDHGAGQYIQIRHDI